MITRENYEEYLMMHTDGELSPDEERELSAFVNEHPHLKKEMELYELTRSAPDTTLVFADKNSLLKSRPAKRTIAFPQWTKYSIAAGMAALIFFSMSHYFNKDRNNVEVAKTDTAKPHGNKVAAPAVAANNTSAVHDSALVTIQKAPVVKAIAHKDAGVAVLNKATKERKMQSKTIQEARVVTETAAISELSLEKVKQVPCNSGKAQPMAPKEVPVFAIENSSSDEVKKTFWDKIPIDDIKKKHLEIIANAAADVYEDISSAKQSLYSKSVTVDVKVEKRKLVISF